MIPKRSQRLTRAYDLKKLRKSLFLRKLTTIFVISELILAITKTPIDKIAGRQPENCGSFRDLQSQNDKNRPKE